MCDLAYQFIGCAEVLGLGHQFFLGQYLQAANAIHDGAHMTYCFYDVAGAGFAFRAHHGSALTDTPERLAKVARATDERDGEEMFIHMEVFIGRRQYF